MAKRKVRLTPTSVNNKLHWKIEEYQGWFFGWRVLGATSSLDLAKNIVKTMEETDDQCTSSV
jgi:hypothetical protein